MTGPNSLLLQKRITLTKDELAEHLGVRPATITMWIRTRRIPAIHPVNRGDNLIMGWTAQEVAQIRIDYLARLPTRGA